MASLRAWVVPVTGIFLAATVPSSNAQEVDTEAVWWGNPLVYDLATGVATYLYGPTNSNDTWLVVLNPADAENLTLTTPQGTFVAEIHVKTSNETYPYLRATFPNVDASEAGTYSLTSSDGTSYSLPYVGLPFGEGSGGGGDPDCILSTALVPCSLSICDIVVCQLSGPLSATDSTVESSSATTYTCSKPKMLFAAPSSLEKEESWERPSTAGTILNGIKQVRGTVKIGSTTLERSDSAFTFAWTLYGRTSHDGQWDYKLGVASAVDPKTSWKCTNGKTQWTQKSLLNPEVGIYRTIDNYVVGGKNGISYTHSTHAKGTDDQTSLMRTVMDNLADWVASKHWSLMWVDDLMKSGTYKAKESVSSTKDKVYWAFGDQNEESYSANFFEQIGVDDGHLKVYAAARPIMLIKEYDGNKERKVAKFATYTEHQWLMHYTQK